MYHVYYIYSKTALIRTHLIRTQASRLRSGRRRRHRQPRPRRHRQPRRGVGTVSAPRVAASGQQAPRVQVCAEGVELLSCAVEFGFRFGLRVPSGSPVPASAPSAPSRHWHRQPRRGVGPPSPKSSGLGRRCRVIIIMCRRVHIRFL